MPKLKLKQTKRAAKKVQEYAMEVADEDQFMADIAVLIREVQHETELRILRGETTHLGNKHMLLSKVYCALSLCSRPAHREAAYLEFRDAFDEYLGVDVSRKKLKRPRRQLLPHV